MHVHASALDAVTIFAMLLVISALWRTVAFRNSDKPLGQAMAYVW